LGVSELADEHDEGHMLIPVEKSHFEDKIDQLLFDARLIVFSGEVLEYQCGMAVRLLEAMVIQNPKKPIKVILNSVGGSAYDGLLVYGTIRDIVRRGTPVIIEVRGIAASMGAIILQAGSTRQAAKYSRFLIHESSVSKTDKPMTVTEQEEQATESRQFNKMLSEILAERTGKSVKNIEAVTKKRDYWLSSKEAKDFGLIDKIL
jgi:ATP-dependent Clp protease protease subunit